MPTYIPTIMRDQSSTVKRILLPLMASFALAGCANLGTPISPQILTFNYAIQTVRDASALITSVQSGQRTVNQLLQGSCNFTADFSSATPPQVFPNGNPGQPGFNVILVSTAPVGTTNSNPPSCTALAEFEIAIGGRSDSLALGTQTSNTNGRVWLVNGRQFTTSEFFQASITSFNPANRRSSGDFRFINRLAGSNTVLIVEGSYFLTP